MLRLKPGLSSSAEPPMQQIGSKILGNEGQKLSQTAAFDRRSSNTRWDPLFRF